MIVLTRLNGSSFAINPDLVERIQEVPDTTVVLVDGATYIVRESVDDVIAEVTEYRARVIALAHSLAAEPPAPRRSRLGVVDGTGTGTPTRPIPIRRGGN